MDLRSVIALAQATTAESSGPGGFSLSDVPTQGQIVDWLVELSGAQFGAILAMVLFACGLVYMLQGWKIFKILVIANAAVLGAIAGFHVGAYLRGQDTWLYTGIGGGMLLAVLAGPLMNYAVSLMGGLAGSFLGYGLWGYLADTIGRGELVQYAWVGALIGLITLGLLAFVILKTVVTIITSVQGSLMTVSGIVALLIKHEPFRQALETPLRENTHLAALLVGVPAVIGIAFQSTASKKAKKKSGGGGGGG